MSSMDLDAWAPDAGTRGIGEARSQFLVAAKQVASDLGTNLEKLEVSDYEPNLDDFLISASGQTNSGIPNFGFSVSYRVKNVPGTGENPYVRASLEIEYERQMKWSIHKDITSMVNHPNYLIRWAGWAMHNFNLEHHPLDLERRFGDNGVEVYGGDRLDESLAQFDLLVKGLRGSGSKVTVLKFRHVSEDIWYRSYSYAIWAETEKPRGLLRGVWIFFYNIGGLDSGGWYGDYKWVEKTIATLGKDVTVETHDVRARTLTNFLLMENILFPRSIRLSPFEPESLYPLLSLPGSSFSESELGHDASETYKKAENSFFAADYAGALRDLRAAVQDALELAAKRLNIDASAIEKPDVTNLAGLLVSKGKLEGRLTSWFGAFTSFANLASHGSYPTERELQDPLVRMRVLGTFILGRQLLREIEFCV